MAFVLAEQATGGINLNTLSYGYLQPTNPDTGDVTDAAMSANMAQLNNHVHDGVTSSLLGIITQSILSASWAAAAGLTGLYSQTVTLPTIAGPVPQLSYDTCVITFKLSSGEQIYPSITRVSTTQYVIFISDNSLTVTAYYR